MPTTFAPSHLRPNHLPSYSSHFDRIGHLQPPFAQHNRGIVVWGVVAVAAIRRVGSTQTTNVAAGGASSSCSSFFAGAAGGFGGVGFGGGGGGGVGGGAVFGVEVPRVFDGGAGGQSKSVGPFPAFVDRMVA